MSESCLILVGRPAEFVERVTPDRPAQRNAPNEALRRELFAALERADADPDVRG